MIWYLKSRSGRKIIEGSSGYIIRGDWGTKKRSISDETVNFLKNEYPHLIIISITGDSGISSDIDLLAYLYSELSSADKLGDMIQTYHLSTYLESYTVLFDQLKEEDPELGEIIIEKERYLSAEHAQMLSGSEYDLSQKVKSHFDRINDQKAILNHSSNLAKCFLADLLTAIYPFDDELSSFSSYMEKLDSGVLPVKLSIDISRCDTVINGLSEFVFGQLLETIGGLKISDLSISGITTNDSDIYINKLIKIIPVVSLTSDTALTEIDNIEYTGLNYYRKDELKDIVESLGLDPDTTLERVWHLYNGHPKLTDWHLEKLSNGDKEKDFIDGISEFTEQAFEYIPDNEKYLVFALAVIGEVDSRLMSIITQQRDNFWYAILSNYYFVDDNEARLCLKKPFRLLGSYLNFSGEVAEYLDNIGTTYLDLKHELSDYTDEDLNTFRFLAKFEKFHIPALVDFEYEGEKIFSDIEKLINIYPDIFIKNKYTYSISPGRKIIFNEYSSLFEDNETISKIPLDIWDQYKKSVDSNLLQLEKKRKLYNTETKTIKSKLSKLTESQKKSSDSIKKYEKRLSVINADLGQFAEKKNDRLSMTFLTLGVIGIIIYMLGDWIFNSFFAHQESVEIINFLIAIASAVLLLLSSKLIYRWIVGFLKKDDIERLKKERVSVENSLLSEKKKHDQTLADIKAAEDKNIELSSDLNNTYSQQEELRERLRENFTEV